MFVLAAAVGCASAVPPIRLYGDARELQQLIGRWSGEYVGERINTGRGSIFFELLEGEDHAHGDVMMTPEGANEPFGRYPAGSPPTDTDIRWAIRYLSVRFVELEDGTVRGVLDSYFDTERQTQASSTFTGRVNGDVVSGTFITRYANNAQSTTGHWSVRRQP